MSNPFRIAAIVTTYFPRSHAGVLVTKFLRGFPTDDGVIEPRTQVASLYIDQIHEEDVGRQLAREFDVPLYESIRGALTLGGSSLAVDAVLLIGEHGDYPRTHLGQEMLPRRYFFEQICGVIAESGRAIPIYNDKHFAYRWSDAQWMYTTAKQLGVPLWAGSAVPIGWRRPIWDHPMDEPIDEAMSIGFHMLERYGYHAIESLQCQVERRAGGETGVRRVQCLAGEAVWEAGTTGRWSRQLAEAAINAIEDGPGELVPANVDDPHVFLIDYADGLQASVLMLGDTGYIRKFAYSARRGETIDAFEYHTDSGPNSAVFGYMGLNIEDFFLTGTAPSPVERTYLTTGILESALISHSDGGRVVETPHLDIHYSPAKTPPRRPVIPRPKGASLESWPPPESGPPESGPAPAESIPVTRAGTVRGKFTR